MGALPRQGRIGRKVGRLRLSNAARPQAGVTLVELAIVLAVVGLLAGVALPSLAWLDSAQHNIASTRTRNALIYAQQWAASSHRSTWVEFDVSQDSLQLFVETGPGAGPATRVPLADPLTRSAYVLDLSESRAGFSEVRMGGQESVRFDATGAPAGGGGSAFTSDGLVTMNGGDVIRVVQETGLVLVD